MATTRGATNGNRRGSSETRRRRRAWLVQTYRANVDALRIPALQLNPPGTFPIAVQVDATVEAPPGAEGAVRACRCYRCGDLLTEDTVTVDRIIPGCKGGTYRRDNIRPACGPCNSETGGGLRR